MNDYNNWNIIWINPTYNWIYNDTTNNPNNHWIKLNNDIIPPHMVSTNNRNNTNSNRDTNTLKI